LSPSPSAQQPSSHSAPLIAYPSQLAESPRQQSPPFEAQHPEKLGLLSARRLSLRLHPLARTCRPSSMSRPAATLLLSTSALLVAPVVLTSSHVKSWSGRIGSEHAVMGERLTLAWESLLDQPAPVGEEQQPHQLSKLGYVCSSSSTASISKVTRGPLTAVNVHPRPDPFRTLSTFPSAGQAASPPTRLAAAPEPAEPSTRTASGLSR
jgi:hypothetical protein